jgi:hypothetical protein
VVFFLAAFHSEYRINHYDKNRSHIVFLIPRSNDATRLLLLKEVDEDAEALLM